MIEHIIVIIPQPAPTVMINAAYTVGSLSKLLWLTEQFGQGELV